MYSDETQSNPILVEVYRGGVLESFHRGAVCAVDELGDIIFSLGDPMQLCYPRSAMKLIQVLPLLHLKGHEKFSFTLEEIAVMCGSHNAEADHLRVVRSILQKIGLGEQELGCGAQYPSSKKDANELIKNGQKPGAIHNNCSGKHAGMLALCNLLGHSTENYLAPEHPIQQLILEYVEKFYEFPREQMTCALDGCTAPIYAIPVYHQALGFLNLVKKEKWDKSLQAACEIVVEAVSKFPFMVAGSKRYCTDMMEVCAPGIIGKTGAEGVFCLAFGKEKIGVCIKIDDGKMLPQYNVAQALIKMSGQFEESRLEPLHHYLKSDIKNFNHFVTGEIRVNEALFNHWESYWRAL